MNEILTGQKGQGEVNLHRNCFTCGSKNGTGLRLKFRKREDGSVLGDFFADPKFEGYSGIIHGGYPCPHGKIVDQVFYPDSNRNSCEVRSKDR